MAICSIRVIRLVSGIGKVRFFSILNHTLPTGLLSTLVKFCNDCKYEVNYQDFNEFESEYSDKMFEYNCEEALKVSGMKMRDYQEAACKLALQKKTGVLQCCTSSGKSMIIYNMIRNMLTYKRIKKILLIVPSVSLVEQMNSDFKDYRLDRFRRLCNASLFWQRARLH